MARGVRRRGESRRSYGVTKTSAPRDEYLTRLVRWFEEAEDATTQERQYAERDRDWYDGKQLTAEEIEALRKRGQPDLVVNRIKRKIDYLKGLEIAQRTDVRAWPRNPDDERAAEAATDALRFVADEAKLKHVKSDVWEHMLIEGYGGAEVVVEDSGDGNPDIRIIGVPWDRLFRDPHSRKADFSDAKYVGLVLWMDEDDVRARWPDAADGVIESAIGDTGLSDTYDDRPKDGGWWDTKRNRLRVVQMYHREPNGEWMRCVFTRWGTLEPSEPVAYRNGKGETVCPLIMRSAYADRDNRRYGIVREMIDPQSEVNKRRSKALHHFTTRQIVTEEGAIRDEDDARRQMTRPDGFIKTRPGARFDVLPAAEMAQGQLVLMQEAKAELDLAGPNAALMGQQGEAPSGKAIQLNQRGGVIEIGPLTDAIRAWERDIYAAIWDRVRQFWTAEKWIRVTDDERNLRWVGLNQRVTLRQALEEMDPDQAGAIAQQMGIMSAQDPRLEEVVEVRNQTNEMAVDIVLDEVPDVASVQQEQFADLVTLARGGLPIPPKAIILASSLRNKDAILEEIEAQQQAAAQAMQAQAAPEGGAVDPSKMADVQRKAARDAREMDLKERELAAEVAIDVAALEQKEREARQRLMLRASAPMRTVA